MCGVMLEPPLNVSVYPFANAVLAFGEQSLPYELDPVTLETRGEFDFHGRLNELSPFAAHAKIDAATGHMFNFGISYSAVQPSLYVYEFDSTGDLLARRRHLLEFPHSNPGPYQAKGIGEMPIDGPAPAIGSAVAHALGGRFINELPLLPERIMHVVESS